MRFTTVKQFHYIHIIICVFDRVYYLLFIQLNLTISNKNLTFNGIETDSTNLSIVYSGNVTSNFYIASLEFENFSTSATNGMIIISGAASGSYPLDSGLYTYNMSQSLPTSAGNLTIKLVYDNDSKVSTDGRMTVEVYGYNISTLGNYITE